MCFTIKFHFSFFASFRFKFFTSLHLSNFRFEAKRNKAKQNSSLFFRFFRFFSLFFAFFRFFHFFSLNFRFALIFSLNFSLFYLRFRFRFLVFRIEVNHVKSGFFSLRSETKFSLQFQILLPKRKWGRTLIPIEVRSVASLESGKYCYLGSRSGLWPIRCWKIFLPGIEVRIVANQKVENIPTWDRGLDCGQSEDGKYSYLGSRSGLWPIRCWKILLPE